MFLTILFLASLAALGALVTILTLRLWNISHRPALQGHEMGLRFQQTEERIRSLKSAKKITDAASAMEQVARGLFGEDVSGQLKKFRETREKAAKAQSQMGSGGQDFEGSLVIPKVFRDPDPDVGLARIFYEEGSKTEH